MKYKNITEQEVTIPGVGIIEAGEEVEMPKDFNNANFKLVKSSKTKVEEDEDEPLKSKKEK